jgi:hypothetical protein
MCYDVVAFIRVEGFLYNFNSVPGCVMTFSIPKYGVMIYPREVVPFVKSLAHLLFHGPQKRVFTIKGKFPFAV